MVLIKPENWIKLLDETRELGKIWLPEELPSIWKDLLKLIPDIEKADSLHGLTAPSKRFDSQNRMEKDELLRVKEYAKANMNDGANLIPKELASCLYYLCIIYSEVILKQRISRLSYQDLKKSVRWALQREWLDENSRSVFQAWQEKHGSK